jgi:hypothetical protein
MLRLYITIDTEYSSRLHRLAPDAGMGENYDRSIRGTAPGGEAGIHYQMDVLEGHGLKGVFFVDPMPALIWGTQAIAAIVEPIVRRGHDVQLHLHSEWLDFADNSPVGGKRGRNIKDFNRTEQTALICLARDLLVEAGAPPPIAFRAGNYGANDETLVALAALGITYDTSFCPGIDRSACRISLPPSCHAPVRHKGVIEVPIGSIAAPGNGQRHAQITALSARELTAALSHAAEQGAEQFTTVSHSFELMSRDRRRINRIVKHRFEQVCAGIAAMPDVATGTYSDNPPAVRAAPSPSLLPHSYVRTASRVGEQLVVNALYGRS